jgi:hypothetical protein
MTATSAIGVSPAAPNHVLGRKLDSIPFSPDPLMMIGELGLVGFVDGYDLAVTGSVRMLAKKPLQLTAADIRFLAVASASMIRVGGFAASAISDHPIRRFANNLLRHDLGVRINRRLYPGALPQGDCRPVGDVHRCGSGAGLTQAAWLEG